MPKKSNKPDFIHPAFNKRTSLIQRVLDLTIKLMPSRLQVAIYQSILLQRTRKRESSSIPDFPLPAKSIINTRLLESRTDLLKSLPKNAQIAEIGVDEGNFSKKILDITAPSKLYLIDSWSMPHYGEDKILIVAEKFNNEINSGQIKILRGLSVEVIESFNDEFFDWVYLDTDHTYSNTKKELESLSSKITPGGYICGHDYSYINWLFGEFYGVVQAVNEFCFIYGWELIYLTNEPNRILSYAIQKPIIP